jgi:hypothetical protein
VVPGISTEHNALGLYAQQILLDGILTAESFTSMCHGQVLFIEKCMGHSLDSHEIVAG